MVKSIKQRYVDEGVDAVFMDAVERGVGYLPGDRVLLRAIMRQEVANERSGIIMAESEMDYREALVHEMVLVGAEVPEAKGFRPGLHCAHVSAAADTLSESSDHRLVLVPHNHIIAVWDPAEIERLDAERLAAWENAT